MDIQVNIEQQNWTHIKSLIHKAFGIYQLVPKDTQQAIFTGTPPFDNLTAIVISHTWRDAKSG